MSKMNRNKSVEICLMAVATCIVLTGLWTVLATPKKALAAPPAGKGNGGGDEGTSPVCILFEGDGVLSDAGEYCDDKQLSIEAIMTQDGHVDLQPNTGRGEGRTLKVYTDLTGDTALEGWRFNVGGWNDSFDMHKMEVDVPQNDVNLIINMKAPPNEENVVNWRLIFDPSYNRWDIDYSESTYVTVTQKSSDTWEVQNTPGGFDGDGNPILSQAVLVIQTQIKNKSVFTYGGIVIVPPFKATVTLVP